MSIAVSELEIIEDLDFEPDLACEAVNEKCPNKAAWRYSSVCNNIILLCQSCHEYVQRDKEIGGCTLCGTVSNMLVTDHWSWKKI